MNRIVIIALALASFGTVHSASAQTPITQADIPFSFSVNGVVLPAGHYVVGVLSPCMLKVWSPGQASAAMVLSHAGGKQANGVSKLVFEKYGDQYFLHEVVYPLSFIDAVITPSKQEEKAHIELAKANGQPMVVAIETDGGSAPQKASRAGL